MGANTIRTALLLHLIAVIIWVGGMFFAYQCLRPAAAQILQPAERLKLWKSTFGRFFPWVWAAIVLLLVTGFYMIFKMGGVVAVGRHVHIMLGLGIVRMLIFAHVFFVPYQRLVKHVATNEYPLAAKQLARIRILVGTNLLLGLFVVAEVVLLR